MITFDDLIIYSTESLLALRETKCNQKWPFAISKVLKATFLDADGPHLNIFWSLRLWNNFMIQNNTLT